MTGQRKEKRKQWSGRAWVSLGNARQHQCDNCGNIMRVIVIEGRWEIRRRLVCFLILLDPSQGQTKKTMVFSHGFCNNGYCAFSYENQAFSTLRRWLARAWPRRWQSPLAIRPARPSCAGARRMATGISCSGVRALVVVARQWFFASGDVPRRPASFLR
jgi:hypothetical protein